MRINLVNSFPFFSKDIRFKRNKNRIKSENAKALEIEKYLKGKTTGEQLNIFNNAKMLVGPVNTISEVCNILKQFRFHNKQMLKDPQISHRNMLVKTNDPEIENMELHGDPIKFSCYKDLKSRLKAPKLNENYRAI